jgi:hypothetical protein
MGYQEVRITGRLQGLGAGVVDFDSGSRSYSSMRLVESNGRIDTSRLVVSSQVDLLMQEALRDGTEIEIYAMRNENFLYVFGAKLGDMWAYQSPGLGETASSKAKFWFFATAVPPAMLALAFLTQSIFFGLLGGLLLLLMPISIILGLLQLFQARSFAVPSEDSFRTRIGCA